MSVSLEGHVELAKHFMSFSIKGWHMPWDQQDTGYLETFTSPSFVEMTCR